MSKMYSKICALSICLLPIINILSADELKDVCGFPLCGSIFYNLRSQGLQVRASELSGVARLAFKGVFAPGARGNLTWTASIEPNIECHFYQLRFESRLAVRTVVIQSPGGTVALEWIAPDGLDLSEWSVMGPVRLASDTQELTIILEQPNHKLRPELTRVQLIQCCTTYPACDSLPVNTDVTGLVVSASTDSVSAVDAMSGAWMPQLTQTPPEIITWWAEYVGATCHMLSISFTCRYCRHVDMREEQESSNFNPLRKFTKPSNSSTEVPIVSGIVEMLTRRTIRLDLIITPLEGFSPELSEVTIVHCCSDASPMCDARVNEDLPGLQVWATAGSAENALRDTERCWSPGDTDIHDWFAEVPEPSPELSCWIYSIQFEAANTYEVFLKVQRTNGNTTQTVANLMHPADSPGGVRWWRSEPQIFTGPRVSRVQIEVWAGLNVTELVVPKLRNMKLTFCCDPVLPPPPQ